MVQFSSDKSNKLQAFIFIDSKTACVIFSSHVEGFVISDQSGNRYPGEPVMELLVSLEKKGHHKKDFPCTYHH